LCGGRLQVYLDHGQQPVIDEPLPDRLPGRLAGLRTWGSEIEFRNFRLQSAEQSEPVLADWSGAQLLQLPAIDQSQQQRLAGLAALCRTMFSLNEFAYLE
ncbi:MAG: hypothetical protein ACK5MO_25525, partial [Planctomyces sp.]